MDKKRLPSQPNQSLIDGLTVLQSLALAKEPIGCTQLAKQLDMETTRVNRLLKTLDYLGMAHRDKHRKYTAGSGMHVLAVQAMIGSGLIHKAIKSLEALVKHGYIVALGVLWQDQVAYLYFWYKGITSAEAMGKTTLTPATLSSLGMILLSKKTDKEIISLYQGKEIPGFKSIDALIKVIDDIRKKDYAEIIVDFRSVAVSMGDPAYAALSMAGKYSQKEAKEIVSILRETVKTIEAGK